MEAVDADIKFVVENLSATVTESNNMVYDRIGEITNDIHRLSDALFENIGNNNSDVNSRLNKIVETLNQINNSITKEVQPDGDIIVIQSKLDAISNAIRGIVAEVSTNVNDNNDVWLEKLDTIANNAFEVKSAILSGLHGTTMLATQYSNH